MVLVLKRLRRRDHSLTPHLTDWEKPEIEHASPGLQGIGLLTPTARRPLRNMQQTQTVTFFLKVTT